MLPSSVPETQGLLLSGLKLTGINPFIIAQDRWDNKNIGKIKNVEKSKMTVHD